MSALRLSANRWAAIRELNQTVTPLVLKDVVVVSPEHSREESIVELTILALGVVAGILGPTALSAQKAPASVVREFQVIEDAWARATHTKDATALESILADEFYSFEVGYGQPESKRELIASTKASTVKWTSVTNTVLDVRLFGETAVVRGEWAGIGTVDGKPLNARDSWMNVFIRRNGRWVAVASHDAPFPVPPK